MTYGEVKLTFDEMMKLRELLMKYEAMCVMEFIPPKYDTDRAVSAREMQTDIERRISKLSAKK